MKTRSHWITLVAAVAIVAIAGCGGKTATAPGPSNAEQTAVTTSVTAAPDLLDDGLVNSSANTAVTMNRARNGALSIEAAITPRFFWRTIVSAVPRLTFAFSDTDSTGRPRQVDVMVTRRLLGTFNILKASATNPAVLDSAHVIHKPLDDQWVRFLRLRRNLLGDEPNLWRIVAATGVKVTSNGATTSIQSLRVQATGVDTTIIDPLQFWHAVHFLHFAAGDSIQLTVTTSRTDDIVLAYWHDTRARFTNNGDGTYSFTLHVGDADGFYHFGVNALSNGTLMDDTLPYDSMAWIIHCFVGPPPSLGYYQ